MSNLIENVRSQVDSASTDVTQIGGSILVLFSLCERKIAAFKASQSTDKPIPLEEVAAQVSAHVICARDLASVANELTVGAKRAAATLISASRTPQFSPLKSALVGACEKSVEAMNKIESDIEIIQAGMMLCVHQLELAVERSNMSPAMILAMDGLLARLRSK